MTDVPNWPEPADKTPRVLTLEEARAALGGCDADAADLLVIRLGPTCARVIASSVAEWVSRARPDA